jgi:hypothetical protein
MRALLEIAGVLAFLAAALIWAFSGYGRHGD